MGSISILAHAIAIIVALWAAYDIGKHAGRIDGLKEARRLARDVRHSFDHDRIG